MKKTTWSKAFFGYLETEPRVRLRYGWWQVSGSCRGSVILLNGKSEFMEKYGETIDDLIQRRLQVFSLDWRGQGLSTRLLDNPMKGYIRSYADYLADLAKFIHTVVLPETVGKRILLAHSMGGHIALRFLKLLPEIVDGAVLVSPMIDIVTRPWPLWLVRWAVGMAKKWDGLDQYIPGAGDWTPNPYLQNPYTSDPRRFFISENAIRSNPSLALGGVTFGWLAATLDSIRILHQPEFAATITTPILMICGQQERIVSKSAQKAMADRLPNCRYVEIAGALHEILNENDSIRNVFWKEFDAFWAE